MILLCDYLVFAFDFVCCIWMNCLLYNLGACFERVFGFEVVRRCLGLVLTCYLRLGLNVVLDFDCKGLVVT